MQGTTLLRQQSPQPPNKPRLEEFESPESHEWRDNLYRALRELQTSARRKEQQEGSNLSQSHIFRTCAPLFIFLCVFGAGVIVPRHPELKKRAVDLLEGTNPGWEKELLLAFAVFVVGVLGGLGILRGGLWVAGRMLQSFCEMNLKGLDQARQIKLDGEFELTQANLIVGGMLI